MESYKEYPIRCKTCNEQIACFSSTYEDLLFTGISEEEALNNIGITKWCSRIAMMNPTIVAFNMENREVIEGFKSVDAADEADAQNESMARPVFNPCMGTTAPIQTVRPLLTAPILPGVTVPRVQANVPGTQIQPTTITGPNAGLQTITLIQPRVQTVIPPVVPGIQPLVPGIQPVLLPTPPEAQIILSPTLVQPLIPGIELGQELEPLGQGIPVQAPDDKKFKEPTQVGTPTINPDLTLVQPTIYIGAGKQTRVLNGRTYLAQ